MSKKQRRPRNSQRSSHSLRKSSLQLPVWKKILFAGFTTITFFGLTEGVLYVVGVQPQIVERDPFVGFTSHVPLFVDKPGAAGIVATSQNKLPWFNAQEFPRQIAANTHRIFCLGGSTTYGRPYDDTTSFCGWLRELLQAADPSHNWEVINAGGISYASYRVALVLEEIVKYQPQLVIVYTGHNEFLENRTYDGIKKSSANPLRQLLSRTRFYNAMHTILRPRDDSSAPQSVANMLPGEVATKLDKGVGPDAFTRDDALRNQILKHFEFNLSRIVDIARTAGAEVILVTPASNLRDCSPFKSVVQDDLSDSDQEQFFSDWEQAERLLAQQRPEEALLAIDRALQVDDRYAAAHFLRGRCLDQLQRYREAKASFARAREEDICPLRAPSAVRQLVLMVAQSKQATVIDFAEIVDQESPQGIPGENLFLDHVHPTIEGHRLLSLSILDKLIELGMVEVDTSWDALALQQVQQIVESRIDREANGKALRNLAKVFAWAGKQKEANRMALQAAKLISSDTNTLYLAANALLEQGDLDGAMEMLQQVIATAPDHAMAQLSLGVAFQKQGRLQEAEQQYRQVLLIDPDNASALNNLGAFYSNQRQWDAAFEHLAKAVASNPRYAKAHHNLGVLWAKQQRWTEAMGSFRRAVAIDPDFAEAHADLGNVYRTQGTMDRAVFHYRQALRMDPQMYMTANSLAWLLATAADDAIRNGEEALRWALRCAEATGYENPGVFNTLAAAYAETGDFANAELWQSKALEKAPVAMQAMCRARIELYRSGSALRE